MFVSLKTHGVHERTIGGLQCIGLIGARSGYGGRARAGAADLGMRQVTLDFACLPRKVGPMSVVFKLFLNGEAFSQNIFSHRPNCKTDKSEAAIVTWDVRILALLLLVGFSPSHVTLDATQT